MFRRSHFQVFLEEKRKKTKHKNLSVRSNIHLIELNYIEKGFPIQLMSSATGIKKSDCYNTIDIYSVIYVHMKPLYGGAINKCSLLMSSVKYLLI